MRRNVVDLPVGVIIGHRELVRGGLFTFYAGHLL
jgi:hypothetical protein